MAKKLMSPVLVAGLWMSFAPAARADAPLPSLTAGDLGQGPYAAMHMRLQKTILKISRSCLVNMRHVREVTRTPRGDFIIVMASGRTVTSSEGFRDAVLVNGQVGGFYNVVSFVSAFVVIRWLIRYVATHDFKPFAWYRIAFGVVVLLTAYFGWVDWKD